MRSPAPPRSGPRSRSGAWPRHGEKAGQAAHVENRCPGHLQLLYALRRHDTDIGLWQPPKVAESGPAQAAHTGRRPWGMPSHYNRRLFTKDWDPMRTDTPVTVYRKDYQPYPYDIPEVSLGFDLAPESTEVRCVMQVRRKPARRRGPGAGRRRAGTRVGRRGWQPAARRPLPSGRAQPGAVRPARNGHGRDRQPLQAGRQLHADGPVRIGRQLLHPVRGRGLSPHHLVRRPPRRDVALPRDAAGHGRLPRAAVQRQPAGLAPAGRRPQRSRMGRPFPSPATCSRWSRASSRTAKPPCAPPAAATCCCRSTAIPARKTRPNGPWIRWCARCAGTRPASTGAGPDRFMVVAVHDFNMGAMENKGLNIFNAAYAGRRPDRHRRQL